MVLVVDRTDMVGRIVLADSLVPTEAGVLPLGASPACKVRDLPRGASSARRLDSFEGLGPRPELSELSLPASLCCLVIALEILAASSGIVRAELDGRVGGEGGAAA